MLNSILKSANNLRDVLDSCKPKQILYAPIDAAKYNHSAVIVNFFGDIIQMSSLCVPHSDLI